MEHTRRHEVSSDEQRLFLALDGLIQRLHKHFIASFDEKEFGLYIEPQVKDRDTGVEFSAFKRLGAFIVQADAASMLVAGDPGMGKTLLSLQIAQQSWYLFIREYRGTLLTHEYWNTVFEKYEKQGMAEVVALLIPDKEEKSAEPKIATKVSLPLWLWVPFLRTEQDWQGHLLETHLKQIGFFPDDVALLKSACQKRFLHLLPIMDGWDELPSVQENLYLLSGFWEEGHWPCLKVLSTCRPEAFVHYDKLEGGYRSIFHPRPEAGNYTILNLCPFEAAHIEKYIHRYVSTLPSDYQPSEFVPLPDAFSKQAREWDAKKAAWIADYQANYSTESLGTLSPSAFETDLRRSEPGKEEKEEEEKGTTSVTFHTQPTKWRDPQTYHYYLSHIPGLTELIQTPFVLSAVIQVLPAIVVHYQKQSGLSQQVITRYTIYAYFVDYWLTIQAERLWKDKEKQFDLIDFRMNNETQAQSITKLKACLFTYSENLARLALNLGGGKIEVNLSDKDTLNPSLVIPAPGQAPHFQKEPVEIRKLELIRSGCLLKNLGNTFKFLHKSVVEFFAARILFSQAHIAADIYLLQRFNLPNEGLNQHFSLNEQLITSEPNIIYLLADQARQDIDFKYLLYQILEVSKGEPLIQIAAANAITILNVAGESFSGRDLRGVHIQGAVLNGALCDHIDLQGADLRGVTAHNACLTNSNLSYVQTQRLDFQELPRVKHSSDITGFCMMPKSQSLLVADAEGYIKQYSYPEGQLLKQWYRKAFGFFEKLPGLLVGLNPVSSLTLHSEEQLAACGNSTDGTAQLIHIQENCLGARLIPPIINQAGFLDSNSRTSSMVFCSEKGRYLAFNSIVCLTSTSYEMSHLQIWDVYQNSFLGEYKSESEIKTLITCKQGSNLFAGDGKKVMVFFVENYRGGPFNPIQILDGNYFSIGGDNQLLALGQDNIIQLYSKTHDWAPEYSIVLRKEQKLNVLALGRDLLAGQSKTELHLWNISSGKYLYTLPIPEEMACTGAPMLCFATIMNDLQVIAVAVENTIYFWPLGQKDISIAYPLHIIRDIPGPFLKKIEFSKQENGLELARSTDGAYLIRCPLPDMKDWIEADTLSIVLNSSKYSALTKSLVSFFFKKILPVEIFIYDQQKHLRLKVSHPVLCPQVLLSRDNQWLVHGYKDIFIHRLEDGKKLLHINTGSFITAIALAADKSWLILADWEGSLSVFNTKTQKRLWHIPHLPVIIRRLDLTLDSQFLVAKGKNNNNKNSEKGKEGSLIFRVLQEPGENVSLKLVHSNMALNLACSGIKIEGTRGLSQENFHLFQQNNAQGIPAFLSEEKQAKPSRSRQNQEEDVLGYEELYDAVRKVSKGFRNSAPAFRFVWEETELNLVRGDINIETPHNFPENNELLPSKNDAQSTPAPEYKKEEVEIAREFIFERAVVKRDEVYSFLNPEAGLSYGLWQVALVRNTQTEHYKHTFIVVEGIDAFGRCFFWRFDLATTIAGVNVEKGFARVVIKTQANVLPSERRDVLKILLKHGGTDCGVESLVGYKWQVTREKVLELYRAVLIDQAKGLLPYAMIGNQSFWGGGGDNCYSWARRHLLALNVPKIKEDLPSTIADYFAMDPTWKLQKLLTALSSSNSSTTSRAPAYAAVASLAVAPSILSAPSALLIPQAGFNPESSPTTPDNPSLLPSITQQARSATTTPLSQMQPKGALSKPAGFEGVENKTLPEKGVDPDPDIPLFVIEESKRFAKGKVGPSEIAGWDLRNVDSKGNCFYDAVICQLELLNHSFFAEVREETLPRNVLRLRIQGRDFKDEEWADQTEIIKLARQFNFIVAIVDTRAPAEYFVYHYMDQKNEYTHTNNPDILPKDRSIVQLAFTGNHYLSVTHAPPKSRVSTATTHVAFSSETKREEKEKNPVRVILPNPEPIQSSISSETKTLPKGLDKSSSKSIPLNPHKFTLPSPVEAYDLPLEEFPEPIHQDLNNDIEDDPDEDDLGLF